jgi:hypothetical protein
MKIEVWVENSTNIVKLVVVFSTISAKTNDFFVFYLLRFLRRGRSRSSSAVGLCSGS